MSILTGKVTEHVFAGSKIMPGMIHSCKLYVPAQYRKGEVAGVYVSQDSMRDFEPEVFDRLITDGAMPVTIGVFVTPGKQAATLPGGFDRSARCPQYDSLGSAYADFIIEELLPHIEKEQSIRFSRNPDDNAIGGCSSGGICAFNAAWERNDFFRRVHMVSPTFSAFRGGDILPVLVRKYETRPIRAFMTVGTDDMRNAAGDWYLEALSMNEAMKYAKYDFEFVVFDGGRHGIGFDDPAVFERAQRFLWKGYPKPVTVKGLPPRVEDVFSKEDPWEPTQERVPTSFSGNYCSDGKTVRLGGKRVTAEPFGNITGLALSCDRWRLYLSDASRRTIDSFSILPDGTLSDRYTWGWLHMPDDGLGAGAAGVLADTSDRLYVATRLGVQLIDNAGHTSGIVPLPGKLPVTAIGFGDSILYAASGDKVFKRKIKTRGFTEKDPLFKPENMPL